jgi:hypothetical protein
MFVVLSSMVAEASEAGRRGIRFPFKRHEALNESFDESHRYTCASETNARNSEATITMTDESASIVTISYADLVAFSNATESSSSEALIECIGNAFGANGLGIIAVLNVPDFEAHRQALLPLAAKLPQLPDLDSLVDSESLYSTGWSHGKECCQGILLRQSTHQRFDTVVH